MSHISYIDEGIAAHESGQREADNPYIAGTDASEWWLDGYHYSASRAEQLSLLSA